MTARRWRDLAQVTGSLLLLALVWRGVGGAALLENFSGLRPGPLLLALIVTVPMHVLSAWRWQLIARRLAVPLPFRSAVGEYYSASLLNAVLPSGLAGDAARVWRHARAQAPSRSPPLRRVLHAVVLERASGQVTLLLVLAIGLSLGPPAGWSSTAPLLTPLPSELVPAALVILGLGAWAGHPGHAVGRALRALARDARRALATPAALIAQLLLSVAVSLSYVLVFWLTARALGSALSPAMALAAVPLVLLAMLLPLSVGGLGLREAAAAVVWPLFGLPPSEGAAVALGYGGLVILGALPGIVTVLNPPQAIRTTPATPSSARKAGGAASRSRSNSTSSPRR